MFTAPRATALDAATHHWQTRAACATVDPEMMFPHDRDRRGIADAKAVCGQCPLSVFTRCKTEHSNENYGVWAGKTAEEHQLERKAQARRANRARQREADAKSRERALVA